MGAPPCSRRELRTLNRLTLRRAMAGDSGEPPSLSGLEPRVGALVHDRCGAGSGEWREGFAVSAAVLEERRKVDEARKAAVAGMGGHGDDEAAAGAAGLCAGGEESPRVEGGSECSSRWSSSLNDFAGALVEEGWDLENMGSDDVRAAARELGLGRSGDESLASDSDDSLSRGSLALSYGDWPRRRDAEGSLG